jgi:hypothetical protein
MSDTPETDAEWDKYIRHPYTHGAGDLRILLQRLERERDEAREALRQIWQSGDAFLPYIDGETINRWRKAAGWEETK